MRDFSVSTISAITGTTIRPVYLVTFELGGTQYDVCSFDRNVVWDTNTYLGNGWLQPLATFEETADIKATNATVTLTGNVVNLVAGALNDARLTDRGYIYLGLLDATYDLIDTPTCLFSGFLDTPEIINNEGEIQVNLVFETALRSLNRQNEFRFTDQSQKAIFPGDKGFEYVATIESWDGYWGKAVRPSWYKRKAKGR